MGLVCGVGDRSEVGGRRLNIWSREKMKEVFSAEVGGRDCGMIK